MLFQTPIDLPAAPAVDPTAAPVVDQPAAPAVDPTAAPVVDQPAAPTVGTTAAPVTLDSPCNGAGYFRDATNCQVFYLCSAGAVAGTFNYSKFTCGGVLVFDTVNNICNYPASVVC